MSGAGIIGRTYVHTSSMVAAAEHEIVEAQKRTVFVEGDEDGDGKPDAPAVPAVAPEPKNE